VEERYGFPVVDAANVFDVLARLGIQPWKRSDPVISLDDYLARKDLTDEQRAELRFAPKTEVVSLIDHRHKPFRGFRSVGKDWATVFCLLPDNLVPIIGEYKHGCDQVSLVPPSGVTSRSDTATDNPMMSCAKREWEEETGLNLSSIVSISQRPLIISGRQSTQRYWPFYGEVAQPIVKGKSKFDTTEQLKLVLVPLPEWLKLIRNGRGIEDCGASITLLALMHLGRL
jgi:hypothetical protein